MIFTGYEILGILVIHGIADFVFQTHWQSINKSKRWDVLLSHTITYSCVVTMGMLLMHVFYDDFERFILPAMAFGGVSFVFHTITDYFTSRWTSKLYAKGDFHNFFVVIEFDQLLHYIQLFITYNLIFH